MENETREPDTPACRSSQLPNRQHFGVQRRPGVMLVILNMGIGQSFSTGWDPNEEVGYVIPIERFTLLPGWVSHSTAQPHEWKVVVINQSSPVGERLFSRSR